MHSLYELLKRLDEVNYHYELSRHRDDAVMVTFTLVGARIEVEVFSDEHMEMSRFIGDESVIGEKELVFDTINKAVIEDNT